jgi:hypothetical protein
MLQKLSAERNGDNREKGGLLRLLKVEEGRAITARPIDNQQAAGQASCPGKQAGTREGQFASKARRLEVLRKLVWEPNP